MADYLQLLRRVQPCAGKHAPKIVTAVLEYVVASTALNLAASLSGSVTLDALWWAVQLVFVLRIAYAIILPCGNTGSARMEMVGWILAIFTIIFAFLAAKDAYSAAVLQIHQTEAEAILDHAQYVHAQKVKIFGEGSALGCIGSPGHDAMWPDVPETPQCRVLRDAYYAVK